MSQTPKRLFFALDVKAPWPEVLPMGRIIEEQYRHLTLAFLGGIESQPLIERLKTLPLPRFKVGIVGKFEQPLFLPPRRAHVVAWKIEWLQSDQLLLQFQNDLLDWLEKNGLPADRRHDFLPHVTVARSPFNIKPWRKSFETLPLFVSSLHLFESLGNSKYVSLWQCPIQSPFEEMDHTADLAFRVYGMNLQELFVHAQIALCFSFHPLLDFFNNEQHGFTSIEEVIQRLNQVVCLADQKIGCPFKAVSYHGTVTKTPTQILQWEMIIDV